MTFDDLVAVLTESQRLGFLGDRPIREVIEHAGGFVDALDSVSGAVADIGAGGGVPGFVIAQARPDLQMSLIDRRTKRTDFVERMTRRVGSTTITVHAGEVSTVASEHGPIWDAVVARGFGPPLVTLAAAGSLVRPDGRIVISEPPEGDRWDTADLRELGVERVDGPSGMAVFHRLAP